MSLYCLWVSLLVFHPGLFPGLMASPPQAEVTSESVIRQATFIFKGTVVKLKATTMPEVKASDSTAVVRVDEVIEALGTPPDLPGKEITVQLAPPGSVSAGQEYTFFTKGWLMGEGMAVIEIAPPSGRKFATGARNGESGTSEECRRGAANRSFQC